MNNLCWKGKAFKALSYGKKANKAGRNFSGCITIFHRGGGSKKLLRRIDFQRKTISAGNIERIEYDPNRSARIALVRWYSIGMTESPTTFDQEAANVRPLAAGRFLEGGAPLGAERPAVTVRSGRFTDSSKRLILRTLVAPRSELDMGVLRHPSLNTHPSAQPGVLASKVACKAAANANLHATPLRGQQGNDLSPQLPANAAPHLFAKATTGRPNGGTDAHPNRLTSRPASRTIRLLTGEPGTRPATVSGTTDTREAYFSYILACDQLKAGDEVLNLDTSASIQRENLNLGREGLRQVRPELGQADRKLLAGPITSLHSQLYQKIGTCGPLSLAPEGSLIHNIELYPGQGGALARAAGTSAQLVQKAPVAHKGALVRLPSGRVCGLDLRCRATIGVVSNIDHGNRKLTKAGQSRWLGIKPVVRGVAMNPIDHPHGGGEGRTKGGRPSVSPWGKPTKGAKRKATPKRRRLTAT